MYYLYCKIEEISNPHRIVVTGNCIVTKEQYTVTVPADEWDVFIGTDEHIQDALPSMSEGDREFLKSGISPKGWAQIYREEDEDETEES